VGCSDGEADGKSVKCGGAGGFDVFLSLIGLSCRLSSSFDNFRKYVVSQSSSGYRAAAVGEGLHSTLSVSSHAVVDSSNKSAIVFCDRPFGPPRRFEMKPRQLQLGIITACQDYPTGLSYGKLESYSHKVRSSSTDCCGHTDKLRVVTLRTAHKQSWPGLGESGAQF